MQIRRVLLLFALVLGLSALVASIAPAPEEEEEAATEPAVEPDATRPLPRPALTLSVRRPGARPVTRRVKVGSSFTLTVSVPKPGDVVLEGLGLRQTVDPRSRAEFALLASPPGRYAVAFAPVRGHRRTIGQLAFVERATVTPRRRDR